MLSIKPSRTYSAIREGFLILKSQSSYVSVCRAGLTCRASNTRGYRLCVWFRPGGDQNADEEHQRAGPQPVDQRVDEDLERRTVSRDGLPIDQQNIQIVPQGWPFAGYGHVLLRLGIVVNARVEFAEVIPVLVVHTDHRACHQPVIRTIELSNRFVLDRIVAQLQRSIEGDGALSLGLKGVDSQYANGHQHHADVDDVSAMASAVAADQGPQGGEGIFILGVHAGAGGAPEFCDGHE